MVMAQKGPAHREGRGYRHGPGPVNLTVPGECLADREECEQDGVEDDDPGKANEGGDRFSSSGRNERAATPRRAVPRPGGWSQGRHSASPPPKERPGQTRAPPVPAARARDQPEARPKSARSSLTYRATAASPERRRVSSTPSGPYPAAGPRARANASIAYRARDENGQEPNQGIKTQLGPGLDRSKRPWGEANQQPEGQLAESVSHVKYCRSLGQQTCASPQPPSAGHEPRLGRDACRGRWGLNRSRDDGSPPLHDVFPSPRSPCSARAPRHKPDDRPWRTGYWGPRRPVPETCVPANSRWIPQRRWREFRCREPGTSNRGRSPWPRAQDLRIESLDEGVATGAITGRRGNDVGRRGDTENGSRGDRLHAGRSPRPGSSPMSGERCTFDNGRF